jgi:hypothetical protein
MIDPKNTDLLDQIVANQKLQRENEDLKDKLNAERMLYKSELVINDDLKNMIKTLELNMDSLNKIIDQYSKKIIFYRNIIDDFLKKND